MVILIMGVEGSGKTTIGSLLARQLSFEFHDADSFHSATNIDKMRRGIALTDSDREPWLSALHQATDTWLSEARNVVLACSALKAKYRSRLVLTHDVKLVYLKVTYEVILDRLKHRHGHYAGGSLLRSQFADLEEPADAISVNANEPPNQLVQQIRSELAL